MTRGDYNLAWLRERYVDGTFSFDTFITCVEVNLRAQTEGWGQQHVPAERLPRWAQGLVP